MKNQAKIIVIAVAVVVIAVMGIFLFNGVKDTSTIPAISENEAVFPTQSGSLSEKQIPDSFVRIKMDRYSADPPEFQVKSGSTVNLAVTSGDNFSHIFKFRDPELSGVAIGVGSQETRAISFQAPEPGEYEFYSDVPFQTVTGKMIVIK